MKHSTNTAAIAIEQKRSVVADIYFLNSDVPVVFTDLSSEEQIAQAATACKPGTN